MKRVLIVQTVILAILLFIFFTQSPNSGTKTQTITINKHKLTVELADTDALRTQGLSGRVSLSKDHGMLFTFPKLSFHYFWMKDMHFSLDFIWIDGNSVVDLTENVSAPRAYDDLKTFTAKFPFNKVIEVNAGTIRSLNISVGNTLKF